MVFNLSALLIASSNVFLLTGCDEQDPHNQCSLFSHEGVSSLLGTEGSHPQRLKALLASPFENYLLKMLEVATVCKLLVHSAISFGQVSGLALGHDGPPGAERHQPGVVTYADCC